MADYDILINAHMQGFLSRDISKLSGDLKNLVTTIDRVNDQTKNYARAQKSLNTALGYGADGQRVYAKTMMDASRNAAVLSNHLKMTKRQVNELNASFGKDLLGASIRRATGRATEFDTALLKARKNLDNINNASRAIRFTSAIRDAQSLSKNILNIGKNMQYVGRNLTIGLTLPLIQFFRLGLDSFKRLKTEQIRFEKIVGQSALNIYQQQEGALYKLKKVRNEVLKVDVFIKEFERMGTALDAFNRDLDNVSYKFGLARDLVQGVAADFATIGLTDTKVIADLVELTATVEKIGDVDISTSREFIQALFLGAVNTQNFDRALTGNLSTMDQYRLAVDQIRGTLALFNTIENNTVVTMEKLSKAVPEMIAVTNLYGLTTAEAAAAFAPMIAAGFEVGASGNSIKVSLQRLVAPAKQNKVILQELANSVEGFNFEVGVGIESVAELARAFVALENAKGAQGALELYARLFGVRQGSRMLTAFVELSRFQESLADTASEAYNIANTIVDSVNKAVIESGVEDELRKALGGGLFTAADIAELGQIARVAGDEYAKGFDTGGTALYEAITRGQAEANAQLESTLEGSGDVLDQISSQAGKIILAQARGIGAAGEDLQAELEKALDSPAVKLARAKETFKGISRELIPPLVDALDNLMPAIKSIANFVAGLSTGTKQFLASSIMIAMAFGPVISVFSNLTQLMGLLSGSMFKVIGAMSKFSVFGRGGMSLSADTLAGVKNLNAFGNKLSRISDDTFFFKGTNKDFQKRMNRAVRRSGPDGGDSDLRRLYRLNQMFAKATAKTTAAQQAQTTSTVQLTQAQQRKILAVRGLASATRQFAAAEQILASAAASAHAPLDLQAKAMAAKKKATTQGFVDKMVSFAASEASLAASSAGILAAAGAIQLQADAMKNLAASLKGLSVAKIDALTKLAATGGAIPIAPTTPVRSATTPKATGSRAPPVSAPVPKPTAPRMPTTGYLGAYGAALSGATTPPVVAPKPKFTYVPPSAPVASAGTPVSIRRPTVTAGRTAAQQGKAVSDVIYRQILDVFKKAGKTLAPEVLYALKNMDLSTLFPQGLNHAATRKSMTEAAKAGMFTSLAPGTVRMPPGSGQAKPQQLARAITDFLTGTESFTGNLSRGIDSGATGIEGKKKKTMFEPSRFISTPRLTKESQTLADNLRAVSRKTAATVKASDAYKQGTSLMAKRTDNIYKGLLKQQQVVKGATRAHETARNAQERIARNVLQRNNFSKALTRNLAKEKGWSTVKIANNEKLSEVALSELKTRMKEGKLTRQAFMEQLEYRSIRRNLQRTMFANDEQYIAAQKATTVAQTQLAAAKKKEARLSSALGKMESISNAFKRTIGPETAAGKRGFVQPVRNMGDIRAIAGGGASGVSMRNREFATAKSVVERFRGTSIVTNMFAENVARIEKIAASTAASQGYSGGMQKAIVANAVKRYKDNFDTILNRMTLKAISDAQARGLTGVRAAGAIKQSMQTNLPSALIAARGGIPSISGGAVGITGMQASLSALGINSAELQKSIIDNLNKEIAAAQAAVNSGDVKAKTRLANLKGRLAVLNHELTQPQIDYINKATAAAGQDRGKLAQSLRELIASDKTFKNKVSAAYGVFAKRLATGTLETDVVGVKVMQAVESMLREIGKTGVSIQDLGYTISASQDPVQTAIKDVQAKAVKASSVATQAVHRIDPTEMSNALATMMTFVNGEMDAFKAETAAATVVATAAIDDIDPFDIAGSFAVMGSVIDASVDKVAAETVAAMTTAQVAIAEARKFGTVLATTAATGAKEISYGIKVLSAAIAREFKIAGGVILVVSRTVSWTRNTIVKSAVWLGAKIKLFGIAVGNSIKLSGNAWAAGYPKISGSLGNLANGIKKIVKAFGLTSKSSTKQTSFVSKSIKSLQLKEIWTGEILQTGWREIGAGFVMIGQAWLPIVKGVEKVLIQASKAAWKVVWPAAQALGRSVWVGVKFLGRGLRESGKLIGAKMLDAGKAVGRGLYIAIEKFSALTAAGVKLFGKFIFIAGTLIYNGLTSAGKALWAGIKAAVSGLRTAIAVSVRAIGRGLSVTGVAIKSFFRAAWNGLKAVGNGFKTGLKIIKQTASNGVRAIRTSFTNIRSSVKKYFNGVQKTVVFDGPVAVQQATDVVVAAAKPAIAKVKAGAITTKKAVKIFGEATARAVHEPSMAIADVQLAVGYSNSYKRVKAAGLRISNGLKSIQTGIVNGFNRATATIANVFAPIKARMVKMSNAIRRFGIKAALLLSDPATMFMILALYADKARTIIKKNFAKVKSAIINGFVKSFEFIGGVAIRVAGGVRIVARQAAASAAYAARMVNQFFFNVSTAFWGLVDRVAERLAPLKAKAVRAYNAIRVAGYRIGQLMTDPASMFLLIGLYADKARGMIKRAFGPAIARIAPYVKSVMMLIRNPALAMQLLSQLMQSGLANVAVVIDQVRNFIIAAQFKIINAMQKMGEAYKRFVSAIQKTYVMVATSIAKTIDSIITFARSLPGRIKSAVKTLMNAMRNQAAAIKDYLIAQGRAILAATRAGFSRAMSATRRGAAILRKAIADAGVAIWNGLKTAGTIVRTATVSAMKSIGSAALKGAQALWAAAGAAKVAIKNTFNSMMATLKVVLPKIWNSVKNAGIAIKNGAIFAWTKILKPTMLFAGNTIKGSFLGIAKAYGGMAKMALSLGVQAAKGLSSILTAGSARKVAALEAAYAKEGATLTRSGAFRHGLGDAVSGSKEMLTKGWGNVFSAQKGLLNTAKTLGTVTLKTLGNAFRLIGNIGKLPVQVAAGVVQLLMKNLQGAYAIGKAIGDIFKSIVRVATDLVKGLLTAAVQLAKTVVSTVMNIAKSMFNTLKSFTQKMSKAMVFGPLIAILITVIVAFKRLRTSMNATGDAADRAARIKERFKNAVAALKDAFLSLIKPIADALNGMFGLSDSSKNAGEAFSNLSALVLNGMEKAGAAIKKFAESEEFKKFVEKAKSAVRQIVRIFTAVFKAIKALVTGDSNEAATRFGEAMDRIKYYVMGMVATMAPVWKAMIGFMLNGLKTLLNSGIPMLSSIAEWVSKNVMPSVVKGFAWLVQKSLDILFKLPEYVPTLLKKLLTAFLRFNGWVTIMFAKLVVKAIEVLVNLIPGLAKIVGEMAVLIGRFVEWSIDQMSGLVKWLDPTYYISKGFEFTTGMDIGDGLANGILRGASKLTELGTDLFDGLLDYDWKSNSFTEMVSDLLGDVQTGLSDAGVVLQDGITGMMESEWVTDLFDDFETSIANGLVGPRNDIDNFMDELLFGKKLYMQGGGYMRDGGGLTGFFENLDIPEYEGSDLQGSINEYLDLANVKIGEGIDKLSEYLSEKRQELRDSFEDKYGVAFDAMPVRVDSETVQQINALAEDIGYAYAQAIESGGDSLDDAAANAASSIKDALMDAAQQFIDLVVDYLGNAISTLKSKIGEELNKRKDAFLQVFDDQIAALDALEKAEEDLFKKQEQIEADRKKMRDRALQEENYRRNRSLAIYEGRVDDARMLDLQQKKTLADNADEDAKTSRDRTRQEQQKQRDIVRAILERQKKDAAKTFDEIISNFEKFVEEIGKHGTYNQEELEAQFQAIVGEAENASADMLSAFEGYYLAIPDMIAQYTDPTIGFFENPLNELVASAQDIFGLTSDSPSPNTILGATAAMVSGIGNYFTDPQGIFQAIPGDFDSVFQAIKDDVLTPALEDMDEIIGEFDPAAIFEAALAEANTTIEREYAKMLNSTNSLVDDIALGMSDLVQNIVTSMAKIENAADGAADSMKDVGGSMPEDVTLPKIDYDALADVYKYADMSIVINASLAEITPKKLVLQTAYDSQGNLIPFDAFGNYKGGVFKGYALGGMVKKYGMGGMASYGPGGIATPGFSTTAVPALLHGGEFVLNNRAVQNIGMSAKMLEMLNRTNFNFDRLQADYKRYLVDIGGSGDEVYKAVEQQRQAVLRSYLPYFPDKITTPKPRIGEGVTNNYNTTNTTNIYVDNFIGEDEWFRSMLKEYNIKHKQIDDRRYNIGSPVYTTYKGASFN